MLVRPKEQRENQADAGNQEDRQIDQRIIPNRGLMRLGVRR